MLSNSSKSIILFGFVMAIGMAAQRAEFQEPRAQSKRAPASVAGHGGKKSIVFNTDTHKSPLHTEKLKGPSDVIIQLASAEPEKAGDIFVLTATVNATEDVEQVEFQWVLPEKVELVSGESFGVYPAMEAGTSRSFSVTLKAGSDGNEQIHLSVKTIKAGQQLGQSAQFNSQDQDTIDAGEAAQKEFVHNLMEEEEKVGGKKTRMMH